MKLPETISVATAARLLRTSTGTIQRMIDEGMLKATRSSPKGWWKVSRVSLEAHVEKLRAQIEERARRGGSDDETSGGTQRSAQKY
jgi:excisionase family DNA binding protein